MPCRHTHALEATIPSTLTRQRSIRRSSRHASTKTGRCEKEWKGKKKLLSSKPTHNGEMDNRDAPEVESVDFSTCTTQTPKNMDFYNENSKRRDAGCVRCWHSDTDVSQSLPKASSFAVDAASGLFVSFFFVHISYKRWGLCHLLSGLSACYCGWYVSWDAE